MKLNKILLLGLILFGVIFVLSIDFASAELTATGCCEKTDSGLYCQNVPKEECSSGNWAQTSCDSVSYCKPGVCYDTSQGTCMRNTPKKVCDANNGSWSETAPASCELGCCQLGDQAAFVPLVRCKKLSSFLGLETKYDKSLTDEVSCVYSVKSQDKGACVFESEFQKTCKITTRANCGDTDKGTFYSGKLCTASELGTICGKTSDTMCLDGKDEVYFKDSCGNAANIYDASKKDNQDYWENMKTKLESCKPGSSNGNDPSCGNCNYLQGSFCRDAKIAGGKTPNYGDFICADLNCENTQNGKDYKHGESWCVNNDKGTIGKADTSVGARFYKHVCVNGEEIVEQCADFKQEECIEDKIVTSEGSFSQAACRVNRWQDCLTQTAKDDCENSDKRDCIWTEIDLQKTNSTSEGTCIPKNTPGLKFWDDASDSTSVCSQANAKCIVTFEKGLFSSEKCVNNCECLTSAWSDERNLLCKAVGDCGPKINWLGKTGYDSGFNITIKRK